MKCLIVLLSLILSTNVTAKCFEPMSLLETCKTVVQMRGELELKAYLAKCKAELAKKKLNRIKPKSTKPLKK